MPSTDISGFALHVYTADKGMKLTSRNGSNAARKGTRFSISAAELDQEYDDLAEMYGKKLQELRAKRQAVKLDPCKPTTRRKIPERARTRTIYK